MSNLCDYMLLHAQNKLKDCHLRAPALRRQIAGNWKNPYDLYHVGNLDIKLFVQDYLQNYGSNPPLEYLEQLAVFTAEYNMRSVQLFLHKEVCKNNSESNLSKL